MQAAALYNSSPQIFGSDLKVASGSEVIFVGFNGQEQKFSKTDGDLINSLKNAKQKKLNEEEAERKRQEQVSLGNAKKTAISNIQALMDDTSDNQTKLTDDEVKTQFNQTNNNLIDGATIKNWKDYINAATTTAEVNTRQNQIQEAIAALRK